MTVYVINHCNKWHEYSGFRFIGVVDENELDNALNKIKQECDYDDNDMETYIDVNEVELNELDI